MLILGRMPGHQTITHLRCRDYCTVLFKHNLTRLQSLYLHSTSRRGHAVGPGRPYVRWRDNVGILSWILEVKYICKSKLRIDVTFTPGNFVGRPPMVTLPESRLGERDKSRLSRRPTGGTQRSYDDETYPFSSTRDRKYIRTHPIRRKVTRISTVLFTTLLTEVVHTSTVGGLPFQRRRRCYHLPSSSSIRGEVETRIDGYDGVSR